MPKDVATHIIDKRTKTVADAAIIADEYNLIHRSDSDKLYKQCKGKGVDFNKPVNSSFPKVEVNSELSPSNKVKPVDSVGAKFRGTKECNFCGKKGHIERECWKKSKNEKRSAQIVALVSALENCAVEGVTQNKFDPSFNTFKRESDKLGNSSRINERELEPLQTAYSNFMSVGSVSINDVNVPVTILRDTGASQSLLLNDVVHVASPNEYVLLQGIAGHYVSVSLVTVRLQSDLVSGEVKVGLVDKLPVPGVSFIMGNDLAGGQVSVAPCVSEQPMLESSRQQECEFSALFPACAVTRSMSARSCDGSTASGDNGNHTIIPGDDDISLADTFFAKFAGSEDGAMPDGVDDSSKGLAELQNSDPELRTLVETAVSEEECDAELSACYYLKNGVLMRKWRSPYAAGDSVWENMHQIVVPKQYRQDIIKLSHDSNLARHMGVRKTLARSRKHFH